VKASFCRDDGRNISSGANDTPTDIDDDQVWADFGDAGNMSPYDLEKWLRTNESRQNGWKEDGGNETIGHHSGRRIVDIEHKKKADLTDEDYAHVRKAVGYVHTSRAGAGAGDRAKHRTRRAGYPRF
jgi:hypothetical protein